MLLFTLSITMEPADKGRLNIRLNSEENPTMRISKRASINSRTNWKSIATAVSRPIIRDMHASPFQPPATIAGWLATTPNAATQDYRKFSMTPVRVTRVHTLVSWQSWKSTWTSLGKLTSLSMKYPCSLNWTLVQMWLQSLSMSTDERKTYQPSQIIINPYIIHSAFAQSEWNDNCNHLM